MYELDGYLSTTNKVFLYKSEDTSSNDKFQGILDRIYVNRHSETDDTYIPYEKNILTRYSNLPGYTL